MTAGDKGWDVFISHASEDKELFVRPFAMLLQKIGVLVWYDEFELNIGDSLSRSIDKGLAKSKFGVVVISPNFIKKKWTEYELRGLVSRQIDEGGLILPIWYNVTREEVVAFSPPLADTIAVDTKGLKPDEVALQIIKKVRPDLYAKQPREELARRASEEALSAFSKAVEDYEREIIKGKKRRALLNSCCKLSDKVAVFRRNFLDFRDAYNNHTSAIQNKGYDLLPEDRFFHPRVGEVLRPTTYQAQYRINLAQGIMDTAMEHLKVAASAVHESIDVVQQAWEEADPANKYSQLGRILHGLDRASKISEIVCSGNSDWWIREKLSSWVREIPEIEASIESAIALLESWATFDPREEAPAKEKVDKTP